MMSRLPITPEVQAQLEEIVGCESSWAWSAVELAIANVRHAPKLILALSLGPRQAASESPRSVSSPIDFHLPIKRIATAMT